MLYNDAMPMMDMIRRMIENGDDKQKILQLFDSVFPGIKKSLLKADISSCTSCDICHCNHTCFEGDIASEIMFVGEAPGSEEEKTGRPFVGPAGAIFNNMLQVAGEKVNERWLRDNVYITNTIKCRPTDTGTSNRTPNAKEIATCKRILDKEIELVHPKVIICVGGTAASTLIHPNFKVTDEHGKFFGDSTKLIAIYHPSYVLRTGETTPEGKKLKTEMWNDLLKVEAYLKEAVEH